MKDWKGTFLRSPALSSIEEIWGSKGDSRLPQAFLSKLSPSLFMRAGVTSAGGASGFAMLSWAVPWRWSFGLLVEAFGQRSMALWDFVLCYQRGFP